jgi:short-subunit dehydrogenase
MKNTKGKTALITGASRGLGPYIAHALAKQSINLALVARSQKGLMQTAASLKQYNIKADIFPCDLTDSQSREQLLDQVKTQMGPLDILVNNAGVERVFSYVGLSPKEIEHMIQINLLAPMLLTRLALPDMISQKSGHIVNMSSLGGKKGSPYSGTYVASKAALIQWSFSLRAELQGTGVSCSVICPGFVSQAGMFAEYNKKAPGIVGETTPEKVADAVIQAIQKDKAEIVVNSKPIWPLIIMEAI